MAKIYLAARIALRYQMRNVKRVIEEAGHTVTSRWIIGPHSDIHNDEYPMPPEQCCAIDIEDVRAADILMPYTDEPKTFQLGGGRHVEFGIAIERGMRIMAIGPKGEHVFHYHSGIEFYPDIYAALKEI